jgi:hypothetical protein
MFQKLALLPSSGISMKPTLLGPLDGANLPSAWIEISSIQWTKSVGFILEPDDGHNATF